MKNELTFDQIASWSPSSSRATAILDVSAVVGLMVLSGWVRLYLPFSPVPVTLQTLTVLLSGYLVGSRNATIAMFVYVGAGLVINPIFPAPWGPTLGYLMAFMAAPYITTRFRNNAIGMLTATSVIYLLGASWLAVWLRCSPVQAFVIGVAPYLVGDAVKLIAAAQLATRLGRKE